MLPTARRIRFPPPVAPGDVVAVVAPSSPFEAAPAWVGLGWLASRYRVRFTRGLFTRTGYLAGDDERRQSELVSAITDPDVRVVLAARGGYGLSRIVHRLPWDRFSARPRWIVGFSDVTALHVEAARLGVASIHGPHLTSLGRADARTRADLVDVLESPERARVYGDLDVLVRGRAAGPAFGGNLTLLHACAAAGRLVVPAGAVLVLEDVTERPYRIDRMLATLAAGGYLSSLAAVALGGFTQCEPGADGVTVEDVLRDALTPLGVPVVSGLRVGHGAENRSLVLGAEAVVDATAERGVVSVGAALC